MPKQEGQGAEHPIKVNSVRTERYRVSQVGSGSRLFYARSETTMQSTSLHESFIGGEGNVCTVHTDTNSTALPAPKSNFKAIEADYYIVSINILKQCNNQSLLQQY